MKKLFLLLLLATGLAKTGSTTEWAWYYIYIQTDYLQGPWIRTDLLRQSDYMYLHPKQFEELFGSEPISLANAIFNHLREETPERYAFRSTLSLSGDTVVIQTNDPIAGFDTVKNELTASFVLNNFPAVKIIRRGKVSLYQLKDITVPYMDLVLPATAETQKLQNRDSENGDSSASALQAQQVIKGRSGNKTPVWLILSLLLNLVLAVLLLRKRK